MFRNVARVASKLDIVKTFTQALEHCVENPDDDEVFLHLQVQAKYFWFQKHVEKKTQETWQPSLYSSSGFNSVITTEGLVSNHFRPYWNESHPSACSQPENRTSTNPEGVFSDSESRNSWKDRENRDKECILLLYTGHFLMIWTAFNCGIITFFLL